MPRLQAGSVALPQRSVKSAMLVIGGGGCTTAGVPVPDSATSTTALAGSFVVNRSVAVRTPVAVGTKLSPSWQDVAAGGGPSARFAGQLNVRVPALPTTKSPALGPMNAQEPVSVWPPGFEIVTPFSARK